MDQNLKYKMEVFQTGIKISNQRKNGTISNQMDQN